MHPVDRNETQTSVTWATSPSSASRNSDAVSYKRRRMRTSGLCGFWMTDRSTVCTHLCCSDVKHCTLIERHSLRCLLLLRHLRVSVCESDSCLEGRTAVSTRCLRRTHMVLVCPSVSSVSHSPKAPHRWHIQIREKCHNFTDKTQSIAVVGN